MRASLAETGTRTGLATLAQTLVTQTAVSSVSFAEPDLDVRVSTDPSLEGGRLPIGDPRVEVGASWSGTLELEGVEHLVSQVPVLGESEDAVGAHLGTVMVAERVPSTWERLQGTSSYLLTYLGHRPGRRTRRVVAPLAPDQAPDPRHGAARDRRARRAPGGDAPRHRGGRGRPRPPAPHHAGQRGRPPAARPARARRSGRRSTTCASRVGCARCSVGENSGPPSANPPTRSTARPRHRGTGRGRHPARPRARHEHDAGHERRPAARHGHDDARPHGPRRPRARDRVVPLDGPRPARPGPRVRQPAAHDQRPHPDR